MGDFDGVASGARLKRHLARRGVCIVILVLSAVAAPGMPAYASPGQLDPTFGMGGVTGSGFGDVPSEITSIAIQPDRKILAGGVARLGDGTLVFAFARYLIDGTPDPSFGSFGVALATFGFSEQQLNGVAIQSNGKILAVGSVASGGGGPHQWIVARLTAAGDLDQTFNGTGWEIAPVGVGSADARAIAVASDDSFVVAGNATNGLNQDFAIARYRPDGSLDPTFSTDGVAMTDFGTGNDEAYSVARQPNGRTVLAGIVQIGAGTEFGLARYRKGGALDGSFSGDGRAHTDFGLHESRASAIAVQSDAKIVVCGTTTSQSTGSDFAVARFTSSGELDTTFSGDGRTTTSFASGPPPDIATGVAVQRNGRIVVGGMANALLSQGLGDFAVARYRPGGALDSTFGAGGRVVSDFGASDGANALALQADGKIVLAGFGRTSPVQFTVARYLAT